MPHTLDNTAEKYRENPGDITALRDYLACAVVYEQDEMISTEELLDIISELCQEPMQ